MRMLFTSNDSCESSEEMLKHIIVYISFLLNLSLLPCAGFSKTPDPARTGNALGGAEAVLLVEPIETVDQGTKYKVKKVLYGKVKEKFLEGPSPAYSYSPGENLVLILSPEFRTWGELNKIRTSYNLPKFALSENDIFPANEVIIEKLNTLFPTLKSSYTRSRKKLVKIITDSEDPWLVTAAEGILWTRSQLRWSELDSARVSIEAAELLSYPFSKTLVSSIAETAKRYRSDKALDIFSKQLENIGLEGNEASRGGRDWTRFKVLSTWTGRESWETITDHLAERLENGEEISLDIAVLYSEHPDSFKNFESSPFAESLIQRFENIDTISSENFRSLVTLATTLDAASMQKCQDKSVELILNDKIINGRDPNYVKSLESTFQELASTAGDSAVISLSKLLHDRSLKKARWTHLAIKSLGNINTKSAADTLNNLFKNGVYERLVLTTLAGMKAKGATELVMSEATREIDGVLAKGDSATRKEIPGLISGGALNVLATRANEIAGIEELILRFYDNSPAVLKDYTLGFLYKLPTHSSAERLFEIIPGLSPDIFPYDLMLLKNLPTENLVPWLNEVVHGKIVLPDWQRREYSYKTSAIMLLGKLNHKTATESLVKIAVEEPGQYSMMAFAALISGEYRFEPSSLARIAISPRQDWDPRVIKAALATISKNGDEIEAFAIQSHEILLKHLKEYDNKQLSALARAIGNTSNVNYYGSLLNVLSSQEVEEISSWANYGLERIKAGL